MNTGTTYLQFPLCALAYEADESKRLEAVMSYSFVETGLAFLHRMDAEARKHAIAGFRANSATPSDFDARNPEHMAAMIGMEKIGITCPSVRTSVSRWKSLAKFRADFETRYGKDVETRLAKHLVFEARDKSGISYREMTLLAALYSVIGAKSYPVRVTRLQLQCRMLGYKSQAIMRTELPSRPDKPTPLSLRQINWTLDRLHERQFFARARANERQTFYSHRMIQQELEQRLITGKSYKAAFHEQRRQADTALMTRIKAARPIKADSPIIVDTPQPSCTNDVHTASTAPSAALSTECSL